MCKTNMFNIAIATQTDIHPVFILLTVEPRQACATHTLKPPIGRGDSRTSEQHIVDKFMQKRHCQAVVSVNGAISAVLTVLYTTVSRETNTVSILTLVVYATKLYQAIKRFQGPERLRLFRVFYRVYLEV